MSAPINPVWQATIWDHPDAPVEVIVDAMVKRTIPYEHWLNLEVDRWAATERPRESWVVKNEATGLVALFSWTKYMRGVSDLQEGE